MKKRIVSIIMTGILAAALLAGCGGSKPAEKPAEAAPEQGGETTEAVDYGSGEIKIWVAENVVDFTKSQCDAFFAANPDMAGYTVTVEPLGDGAEGDPEFFRYILHRCHKNTLPGARRLPAGP